MLAGVLTKEIKDKIKNELQMKFDNDKNSMTIDELKQLMDLKSIGKDKNHFKIKFNSFYIRNKSKDYPEELSIYDIGRYDLLMKYLSKYHDLRKANRKDSDNVRIKKLTEHIQLSLKKMVEYFNKMQKYNMLKYIKQPNGDFIIIINPTYSNMQGDIDYTVYTLFKNDIDEYLMPEAIEYLKRIHDRGQAFTTKIDSKNVS